MEVPCILGLVILVVFGAILIALWDLWARQAHPRRTLERWQRQGREVQHAPVYTLHYGTEPRASHVGVAAESGAVGVVDNQLVFIRRGGMHETIIEADQMRWIGSRNIDVKSGKYTVRKTAVMVHYEYRGRWYAAAYVIDGGTARSTLLRALEKVTGLDAQDVRSGREDYGPSPALRLTQDIYGKWHDTAGRLDGDMQPGFLDLIGKLYLAPDRLLYDYRNGILLSQLRRVDVYEQGGLQKFNPFSEELIRIEYANTENGGSDKHEVIGFLVHFGHKWAGALRDKVNIPVEVHAGRKKKQ